MARTYTARWAVGKNSASRPMKGDWPPNKKAESSGGAIDRATGLGLL
jgi:hypothetical protein